MKANDRYDAIVIGGGHNGLVAAATLAKAGLKVLVLERREVLGGAAATEAAFPGFKVSSGALDSGLFLPEIVSSLHLNKHGLAFLRSPAVVHALQPTGEPLTLWRDPRRSVEEIARFSPADAKKYPAYLRQVSRMSAILRQAFTLTPPSLPNPSLSELLPWLRPALKARRLGKREFMELVRVLPMSITDFLDEWFEHPALKAALGAAGVRGSLLGPRSPGTATLLLYQAVNAGEAGFRASSFVQGGTGMLSEALAGAARRYGAEIRCGAPVSKILMEGGRLAGVVLEQGEQIQAGVVLSSANPRSTFFDLVGPEHLEVSFVREIKNIRFDGCLARLNLALSGLPAFRSLPQAQPGAAPDIRLNGYVQICPDLDYLERAYDDAKYGRISRRPALEAVIPTLMDSSMAPTGQHLMSVNVQYAPYHLQEGNWNDQGPALAKQVIDLLEEYAPGLGSLILHQQLLTPLDLEREYGLEQGCIYHGQMALDQMLFMRPTPASARYRTPVDGLYLCGAGTHPGGGVTGAPGLNAARVALKAGI